MNAEDTVYAWVAEHPDLRTCGVMDRGMGCIVTLKERGRDKYGESVEWRRSQGVASTREKAFEMAMAEMRGAK